MSLSLIDLDDKEIIEAIRAKYYYHLQHSLKYKSMLDAYDGNFSAPKKELKENTTVHTVIRNIPKQEKQNRETFESIVLNILSDGQPRLVSELIEDYFGITKQRLKTKDFSSKLSIRAKSGNKIKNVKFNDFPLEKRFWWGKSEWFDGNLLKPQYVEIVHEKFKTM